MAKKFIRKTGFTAIIKSDRYALKGCSSYVVYNMSNVNVTLNNILVLRPGQFLSGPTEHPDIADHSELEFQFDMLNDPKIVQPDTGPFPIVKTYTQGDPVPARDLRVIIIESFITEA